MTRLAGAHLEGEVDWSVVGLEAQGPALMQQGLVEGVEPLPQAAHPLVVVGLPLVLLLVLPQQVGVEVPVGGGGMY